MQGIRDAILIVFSVVIMSTSYGKWVVEPAHYVLFGMAAGLFVLTVVNIILLLAKVKRKAYFYFNSIFQLIPSFILLGLLGIVGAIFFILNLAILITLREKKEKQNTLKSA